MKLALGSSRLRAWSRVFWLVVPAGALVCASIACGSDSEDDVPNGATPDGGTTAPLADVSSTPSDGSSPSSTARFVHLASNLGDVDFCLRSSTSETFVGPVLGGVAPVDAGPLGAADADAGEASDLDADNSEAGEASVDAGADLALSPRTMTNYLSFPGSGTFQVALVPGGQATCANPIATLIVTLDPGKLSTVALVGVGAADYGADGGEAGANSLALIKFVDDPTPDAMHARVRMINAALGTANMTAAGSLTVSAKGSESPVLASRVDPAEAAAAHATDPTTDALGYSLISPIPPATALVIAAATGADSGGIAPWTSAFTDLGLDEGALHTGFIVSDDQASYAVVWCHDTSTVGKRIDCRTIGKPVGDQ